MNILYIAVLFMLGCNVDVFGITSKLKEAHLDIFDSTSRAASLLERLFGDHAIVRRLIY